MLDTLPKVRGEYRENISLAKYCWFGSGGNASIVFKPADTEDLAHFIRECQATVKYQVLGVGSNIIVRDEGYDGVIIKLGRSFNWAEHNNAEITVGASTLDVNCAKYCAIHGIGGLEFLSGIPGTIGGALAMNAGAYGTEIKDVLVSAEVITATGEILHLSPQDIGYVYRGKALSPDHIFTSAKLRGKEDIPDKIQKRIDEIQTARKSTQPINTRTGGSTFKNPPGHKAWELIDKAGCRGLRIGGAEVSNLHCNFIINYDGATSQDIIDLICEVQSRVKMMSGVSLEPEIKIL